MYHQGLEGRIEVDFDLRGLAQAGLGERLADQAAEAALAGVCEPDLAVDQAVGDRQPRARPGFMRQVRLGNPVYPCRQRRDMEAVAVGLKLLGLQRGCRQQRREQAGGDGGQ